jgi:hypothetical protein
MKVAPVQKQLETRNCQPRSLQLTASKSRFARVLSSCIAAAGLLMATPAFGQDAPAIANSEKQPLTSVTAGQGLVCDAQQPGQSNQSTKFEQKTSTGATEIVELTPVTRGALFSPELDGMLASALLWTIYLGLPISLIVAIWCYDQRAREQTAKLVEQVATLERIWQKPQAESQRD